MKLKTTLASAALSVTAHATLMTGVASACTTHNPERHASVRPR